MNFQGMTLNKIGKGHFSTVYLSEDDGMVYVFTTCENREVDYSKEAVAEWADDTNVHVPAIERVEDDYYVPRRGWCNVYKMPLYNKLQAGNEVANRLIHVYKTITSSQDYRQASLMSWYTAGSMLLAAIEADEMIPDSIKEAIGSIFDACTNYGEYVMEFARRNLMMDDEGNLILLDIIFNPKAL